MPGQGHGGEENVVAAFFRLLWLDVEEALMLTGKLVRDLCLRLGFWFG